MKVAIKLLLGVCISLILSSCEEDTAPVPQAAMTVNKGLFGLALQSGETHIAGRGLDRQIQISSRHRLGVPHRSGMPHSREVALFMKHTELFAFRKGLPVAAVGRYFQLDFRKSRPVCVEPQFHGSNARICGV